MELILCFLIAMLVTGGRSMSDIIHAAKGTTPPRIERARLKAQARPAAGRRTPGPFRQYASAVWADAWSDAKAAHVRGRAEKAAGARPTFPQRVRRFGRMLWEPVGEPRLEDAHPSEPVPAPDPWAYSTPAGGGDRLSDPLGLAGRTNAEPEPPSPAVAPEAPIPDPTPSTTPATNGGTTMTAPTGEAADYETHKAELQAARDQWRRQADLAEATTAAVQAAKAAMNEQQEQAREAQAAAQAKSDSLDGANLDGETKAHAAFQAEAVDPNRLNNQYEALEGIERDAVEQRSQAEAALAAVDAEEATIDAKYGDAANTVASELGGNPTYLGSGGPGGGAAHHHASAGEVSQPEPVSAGAR